MIKVWNEKTLENIVVEGREKINFYSLEKSIGDCPILLVETIAIRETLQMMVHITLSNVIIGSDFQIAIQSIEDRIKISNHIINFIKNIILLC